MRTVVLETQRPSDEAYLHLLATADARLIFDGSGMTPLLPFASSRSCSTALVRLPAIPFRFAGTQIQPVVVRSARLDNQTWIYAVNASQLTLSTDLVLDCPSTATIRPIVNGTPAKLVPLSAGKSRVHIEMEGHCLWAVQLEQPLVNVAEVHVHIADEVLAGLAQRIERLSANMRTAAQASAKPPVAESPETVEQRKTRQVNWETEARQPDSLDGDELRQLTKTVSSVKLAWEEGRYADCQRMLDGYWGQLLLAMPMDPTPVRVLRPSMVRPKVTATPREKTKR
jgi:hypothetical protein